MHGRTSHARRFSDKGLAILLFAGLSQLLPWSPRTVGAGDQREAKPISRAMVSAIRDADAQAIRKLIEDGADVNARDAEGNTPLILASFYASPKCVDLLLEKGADANAANKAGVTALIRAATSYEKTRLLVDAGAKVRVRTADLGNTPLILAARRAGNSRTVELLLEHGADANERNDAGVESHHVGRGERRSWRRCDCCWTPARRPMISRHRRIREPPARWPAFVRR